MKITKSFLKQIIKEELEKIEESLPLSTDLDKLVDAEMVASGLSKEEARSVVMARLNIQDMSKTGRPSPESLRAVAPSAPGARDRLRRTLPSDQRNGI